MKSSHCEDKQKDRHLDVLIDEENGLRIIVLPLGAELISLARIMKPANGPDFFIGGKRSVSAVSGLARHAAVMADHFFVSKRAGA